MDIYRHGSRSRPRTSFLLLGLLPPSADLLLLELRVESRPLHSVVQVGDLAPFSPVLFLGSACLFGVHGDCELYKLGQLV